MQPKVIHLERTTSAPRGQVWRLLDESARWVEWTPIDECRVTVPESGAQHEIRSVRNGRVRLQEEIVERRSERRLCYTVLSGLAVRDYLATVDLDEVDGGTKITWHTEFVAKVPGTGWLYRYALRRATVQFIDGLARVATAV